eukprot:7532354-Pyramimonas_sp.AAC.1
MGPALHVRIRAGHPQRVTSVTFGLLRHEYGGSITGASREPLPMLPALHVRIRAGHPQRATVVTVGLLRPEYGGSLEREPRL